MRFSHGVSWSQPMLFANAFDKSDLLNWIRRFRKHRVQLYCCAVAMVELGAARVAPELSTSARPRYTLGVLCMLILAASRLQLDTQHPGGAELRAARP
jgi:hypothetical protein